MPPVDTFKASMYTCEGLFKLDMPEGYVTRIVGGRAQLFQMQEQVKG
jgi:hypothetical protein